MRLSPPAPPASTPTLAQPSAAHPENADAPSSEASPVACAVQVLFGDTKVREHRTVGEAIAAPIATTPVGARIVKHGRVRARFTHAVDSRGRTFAGWMLCDEYERRSA